MSESKYKLIKCKGYNQQIIKSLRSFQNQEEFADVTLVCENHVIKTNKIILCACSPYFYNIIKKAKSPHPVIQISNTSVEILSKILRFMFSGKILISQDKVEEFLRAAKKFQLLNGVEKLVHDVNGINSDSSYDYTTAKIQLNLNDEIIIPDESVENVETKVENGNDNFEASDDIPLAKIPKKRGRKKGQLGKKTRRDIKLEMDSKNEIKEEVGDIVENIFATKRRRRARKSKDHIIPIRTHIKCSYKGPKSSRNKSLACLICKETIPTQRLLSLHMYSVHKEYKKDFECYICLMKFHDKLSVAKHLLQDHENFKIHRHLK